MFDLPAVVLPPCMTGHFPVEFTSLLSIKSLLS
jgi:hypothetical protein